MKKFLPAVFIITLVSIHFGALVFVASSYLRQFFSTDTVSLLFVLSAVLSVFFYSLDGRLLSRLSKGSFLLLFLSLSTLSSLGLAISTTQIEVLLYFFLYSVSILMVYYALDLILETMSNDTRTGEIRGVYNTFMNAGVMLGPLFLTLFSLKNSLDRVYLAASFILVPCIVVSLLSFKLSKKSPHLGHTTNLKLPLKEWWSRRDIRAVTLARFILESFFTFMVIYTPIYLHEVVGFDWTELGIIFTVALIPFVIFTWPIGELADRYWGEKEIMALGFFFSGVAALMMPFLGLNFWTWMSVLFFSRVGASFIEITTEVYFFKKVGARDSGLISIFRITRPLSNGMGALFGLIFLNFFSMEKIFFIVAILLFLGLRESLYIRDTL